MNPWEDAPCAIRWCSAGPADPISQLCPDHHRGWDEQLQLMGKDPHPFSIVMRWQRWVDRVSRLDGRGTDPDDASRIRH